MKLFLCTVVSTVAFTAAAHAADSAVMEEAPVAAVYDWSGAYVGVFGGGAWGADISLTDEDDYNGADGDFDYDGSGFLGGVHAGYNWQMNQVVFGVEAEIGYLGLDEEQQFPDYEDDPAREDDSIASVESDIYASLTGRVGYAFDNILVYGKGGFAGLNTDVSFIDDNPVGAVLVDGTSASDFLMGYTVGGGFEVGFTPSLSAKVEYMFADFEDISHTATDGFGTEYEFNHEIDGFHTVKVGLSYSF